MSAGRRGRHVTKAEARLWRLVVRDARPLADQPLPEPEAPVEPHPPVSTETTPADPNLTRKELPALAAVPARRTPPPRLEHGTLPGVDRRTAQRLRRGQLAVDAKLDLHGMTQDAAHAALVHFIKSSQAMGRRCVIVITGKGGRAGSPGVLRAAVPRWLNEPELRSRILGFSLARREHGGEGAMYVLLKRQR